MWSRIWLAKSPRLYQNNKNVLQNEQIYLIVAHVWVLVVILEHFCFFFFFNYTHMHTHQLNICMFYPYITEGRWRFRVWMLAWYPRTKYWVFLVSYIFLLTCHLSFWTLEENLDVEISISKMKLYHWSHRRARGNQF